MNIELSSDLKQAQNENTQLKATISDMRKLDFQFKKMWLNIYANDLFIVLEAKLINHEQSTSEVKQENAVLKKTISEMRKLDFQWLKFAWRYIYISINIQVRNELTYLTRPRPNFYICSKKHFRSFSYLTDILSQNVQERQYIKKTLIM